MSEVPLWDFWCNDRLWQVRAHTRDQAIACLRVTLPKSDVDYTSLRPAIAPEQSQFVADESI